MARKKNSSLFSEIDKEKQCINYLHERGYAVFKAEKVSSVEEEEAVRKLRAVGYRVEHCKDTLVKVDSTKIKTVDDVAIYFHEMMKRHNPKRHNPKRLSDPKTRIVDHSVINTLLAWMIDQGDSVSGALNDMFLLMDCLFERAKEQHIDVRGIGILSINVNKPFVLSLLDDVKIKKDARLNFEVEQLIHEDQKNNYLCILMDARKQMDDANKSKPEKKNRNIKVK